VGNIVARLRDRGYPAPKYLAIVDCGEISGVVQELVNGEPAGEVGVPLARSLLNLNSMQRGALAEPAVRSPTCTSTVMARATACISRCAATHATQQHCSTASNR